jgi:elongation factor Ts
MAVTIDHIKKLRKETGAGIADCRQALEDAHGDPVRARTLLTERGFEKAAKKAGKETSQGIIVSYVHATRKIGVLVELKCETDFVARTDEFQHLAHEIALQVAAMNPKDVSELLKSAYIRDANMTIDALVRTHIAKVGENITVGTFARVELGK